MKSKAEWAAQLKSDIFCEQLCDKQDEDLPKWVDAIRAEYQAEVIRVIEEHSGLDGEDEPYVICSTAQLIAAIKQIGERQPSKTLSIKKPKPPSGYYVTEGKELE